MKRKTHLFYTKGPDSNFLTFSNYAEYLTGNYLSSNHKIFPSKFLCVYIKSLSNFNNEYNEDTNEYTSDIRKRDFIVKELVGYYENKLAILRDDCISKNKVVEKHIYPLNYLIDTLMNIDVNTTINDNNTLNNDENNIYNADTSKDNVQITYIGDISEQDYNGTYTDSICVIDGNNLQCGIITESEESLINENTVCDITSENLYGWNNNQLPEEYKNTDENINIKYDIYNEKKYIYNYTYDISILDKSSSEYENNINKNEIKFNVIIPLFDIVEINSLTNNTSIDIDTDTVLKNTNIDGLNIKNIPYGIWFSNEDIILKRDKSNGNFPVWSLVVSMQFKSLPYFGNQINPTNQNINSKSPIANEYATFAQVLSRQNDIINKFNKTLTKFNEFETKLLTLGESITNIESTLSAFTPTVNISQSYDNIQKEMIEFKTKINKEIKEFKEEVENNITDAIKWQIAK